MTSPTQSFWPEQVPVFGHPDFESELRKWLLSVLPAEILNQQVTRRHLDVLLHLADGVLTGTLEGLREAYASARVQLGQGHPPETIAAAMAAIAGVGADVAKNLAFVEFVRSNRNE